MAQEQETISEVEDLKAQLAESIQREHELKERFENYSDFMENSSLPLHWVDSTGTIIWANQAELDTLGYSREEYIGTLVSKYHADQEVIGSILESLSNFQTLQNYPARLICKDGTIKHVLINSNVLVRDGKFVHTRCLTRDITSLRDEQKKESELLRDHIAAKDSFSEELARQVNERTEELKVLNDHLRIQNETFKQAEESSGQGSYSFNLSTGELKYSDNLYRILGFDPGEFLPSIEEFNKHVHPDDQDYIKEEGEKVVSTQMASEWKYRMVRKDGTLVHIRGTGRVIPVGDHQILVGTLQDVTQDAMLQDSLMAKEKILAIKNEELERQNKELASFSYVASHDLQEPLRKIRTFSSRILSKQHDVFSDESKYYFSRITGAAERMQHLIEALLSYSRANTPEKDFAVTDLNAIISDIKSILQDVIEEKNAVITSDHLPTLKVVHLQFQQLFLNLISNGVKYSRDGVPPRISITAELLHSSAIEHNDVIPNTKYWKISVTDNGIGFEQQYEDKIFELFQRLHGKQEFEGTGIGLSICKKIVQNHNGFMKAHGVPDVGSTFSLYIPANPVKT